MYGLQTIEKTNNNNKKQTNNNNATFEGQLDLNGQKLKPKLFRQNILCENHYSLLETFYLTRQYHYTMPQLKNLYSKLHPNTINNFIKLALSRDWVEEIPKIKKSVIHNTPYSYVELPARLETGQTIKDNRIRYFRITQTGIKIFELNKEAKNEIETEN